MIAKRQKTANAYATRMTERRYSREEVDAILGRAVERERSKDDLSRDQLLAIAQEIGVAPESIDRAIGEITAEKQEREELAQWRGQALRGFIGHLIPYLCVNGLLVLLNFATTRFPWALFPLLGWGIGIFFHLMAVISPNPEQLRRRMLREQERMRRRQLKRQVRAGARELETAVNQGIATLLQAAAHRVNQGAESMQQRVDSRTRVEDLGTPPPKDYQEPLEPDDPRMRSGRR